MTTEKWLVIDAHTHYLPREAVERTGVSNGFDYSALLKGDMSLPYKRIQDIEGILKLMEDSGVDMAVMNQSAWSPQGIEVCKAMNDGYARLSKDYPGKFISCGHVPLQGGQEVVEEVDRCIDELGLQGISLVSSMPDVTMDMPELWPMYEKIQMYDVPVVIHPSVRYPIWGGGEKYQFRRTISREYDIAKATVEMMYGVLADFPRIKVLTPHYGGGMPGLFGRLRAWFEPEGMEIPDDVKNCPKTPRELDNLGIPPKFDAILDNIYFDTAGAGAGWLPAIQAALWTIRTDRICFGTDYPYDMHCAEDIRIFIDTIKNLDITDTEKKNILGDNVRELFNLK